MSSKNFNGRPPSIPNLEQIPDDLRAGVQTYRNFAVVHDVLVNGQYPYAQHQIVADCVRFMQTLHEESMRKAAFHDKADLVPELKEFKEKALAHAAGEPTPKETTEEAKPETVEAVSEILTEEVQSGTN
jgi:hypothetical protein